MTNAKLNLGEVDIQNVMAGLSYAIGMAHNGHDAADNMTEKHEFQVFIASARNTINKILTSMSDEKAALFREKAETRILLVRQLLPILKEGLKNGQTIKI